MAKKSAIGNKSNRNFIGSNKSENLLLFGLVSHFCGAKMREKIHAKAKMKCEKSLAEPDDFSGKSDAYIRTRCWCLCWFELQAGRVDAIAQAGGRGAVGEDVAQVGVADCADDFGAQHTMAAVGFFNHVGGVEGLEVAGPAAAG